MKRVIEATLGVFLLVVFVSPAGAINISLAEVQDGVAVVQGHKAAKKATITWEGSDVTQANGGGKFSFSGTVPHDCVGTLSDGVDTIDVVLFDCTPAASAPVPKTGQTASFDEHIPQRDDGALQKGVAWPKPRFTVNVNAADDNGAGGGGAGNGICDGTEICNGTVTDNLTGLIWLKKAACFVADDWDFDGKDYPPPWYPALYRVTLINAGVRDCGDTSNGGSHQTDWRLPNVRELLSLVDYGRSDPALPADHPFTFKYDRVGYTWSSTTSAYNPDLAFAVDFVTGQSTLGFKAAREYDVMPVRGGF